MLGQHQRQTDLERDGDRADARAGVVARWQASGGRRCEHSAVEPAERQPAFDASRRHLDAGVVAGWQIYRVRRAIRRGGGLAGDLATAAQEQTYTPRRWLIAWALCPHFIAYARRPLMIASGRRLDTSKHFQLEQLLDAVYAAIGV